MKAKIYLDNGTYGIDYHLDTPRDDPLTIDITEEERDWYIKAPLSEVQEKVRDLLKFTL